jgi:hypothetical protein
MTDWIVSRVAPLSASPIDEFCNPSIVDSTAEDPVSAVGFRLFWATIVGVIIGIGLPIGLGWVLQSPVHPKPDTITRAVIVAEPPSRPAAMVPPNLPKAQAPPLEFLGNHLSPRAAIESD